MGGVCKIASTPVAPRGYGRKETHFSGEDRYYPQPVPTMDSPAPAISQPSWGEARISNVWGDSHTCHPEARGLLFTHGCQEGFVQPSTAHRGEKVEPGAGEGSGERGF